MFIACLSGYAFSFLKIFSGDYMYKKIIVLLFIMLMAFSSFVYAETSENLVYENNTATNVPSGRTFRYDFDEEVTITKGTATGVRFEWLTITFYDSKNKVVGGNSYSLRNGFTLNPALTNVKYFIVKNGSSSYDGFSSIQLYGIKYEPPPPLSFVSVSFDKLQNVINYVFNRNISVNKEDISFTNDLGIQQDFNYTVKDNILSILSLVNHQGQYNVQPKKVYTDDKKENTTNIPAYVLKIQGIELVYKNFGNFISADLQNLILSFDRNISSAKIILKNNTDNSVISTDLIINNEKLIIDYDPFKEDTGYTLIIESLNAQDGSNLDKPLVFDFKTVKTTGNVGIDIIVSEFLNVFTVAQNRGILIVVLAIGIGVIFIISKWLWNKTKFWLKKS